MTTYVSALYTTILLMRYAKEAYEWYAWLPAMPTFLFPSYWWPPSTPTISDHHETIATIVNQYVGE